VKVRSHALATFWKFYDALPDAIQEHADKQYQLFRANPGHSSLRLKQVGAFWVVRTGRGYRALARRQANDFFCFWIGSHDEYERILKN
jgi:hypothetical protein